MLEPASHESQARSSHHRLRAMTHRSRGQSKGPVIRLISPSDLGEVLKPFVFLDLIDTAHLRGDRTPGFGLHPHSGIATLTWLFEGSVAYEDDQGRCGRIEQGWMEWMHAGSGAWHGGDFGNSNRLRGFQLWLALPPAAELALPYSRYVGPSSIGRDGPVAVLLGRHGRVTGPIATPSLINYFAITLAAGQRWRFQPPTGHTVAWAAVSAGALRGSGTIAAGEVGVFENGEDAIEFVAIEDAEFVFGSAAKHPHELVLGRHSVHTCARSLAQGEKRIQTLGEQLRAAGRF
ncbi:pirin family protein [Stenotrophomonas sp. SY1]|uniref:pirin family protein n=1 Tax=Stenotrophomonas sp. SY1 TaxID=477235 RepID=UPI001E603BBC|nr:pirin family protein [Stenotrophomonas sp. SY1]MCD9087005.1 pirin family protein [Stenotrophomonas sp. SY1]